MAEILQNFASTRFGLMLAAIYALYLIAEKNPDVAPQAMYIIGALTALHILSRTVTGYAQANHKEETHTPGDENGENLGNNP